MGHDLRPLSFLDQIKRKMPINRQKNKDFHVYWRVRKYKNHCNFHNLWENRGYIERVIKLSTEKDRYKIGSFILDINLNFIGHLEINSFQCHFRSEMDKGIFQLKEEIQPRRQNVTKKTPIQKWLSIVLPSIDPHLTWPFAFY